MQGNFQYYRIWWKKDKLTKKKDFDKVETYRHKWTTNKSKLSAYSLKKKTDRFLTDGVVVCGRQELVEEVEGPLVWGLPHRPTLLQQVRLYRGSCYEARLVEVDADELALITQHNT